MLGGWGLSLLGLALLAFGIVFLKDGLESVAWPRVEGRVLSSVVRVDISQRRGAARRGARSYYAEVTYQYGVRGATYTSSRYALGETSEKYKERSDAEAVAAGFRKGQPIPVYYDPDDPASAVLEAGAGIGAWVPLLLSFLFLGVGVPLIWMTAKTPRNVAHGVTGN
jgi:hypothetical protein